MHHGEQEGEVMRRFRQDLERVGQQTAQKKLDDLTKQLELGATGQYPEGKLTEADEGEIKIAIGVHEGKVVIHFGGKPVKWIGLSAQQAREMAESIRQMSYRTEEAKK